MKFMLQMTWKKPMDDEIMALMPAEQARVGELIGQGVQEANYLAADRSTAWVVWNCASADEVDELVQSLPVWEFTNFVVTPLGEEG